MDSIWLAFITGLTTGGISCLVIQGGLLASAVTGNNQANAEAIVVRRGRFFSISLFLTAKILSHVLLGLVLGFMGASLVLTPKFMGILQVFVGLYLVATAARIADIHPIFRYTVLQPPVWTYKLLKSWSRDSSRFAPAMLGFFTVFMPCGITQAMMVLAVASGNPLIAAGILGAFVLGTSPVFFILGVTVVEFLRRKAFAYVAAGLIAVFGVMSVNGGMVLQGSFYTLQNFYRAATLDVELLTESGGTVAGMSADGKQDVTIYVQSNGFRSTASTLKAGVPVSLRLVTNNTKGCARAFTIPEYNVTKILPETGTETVEFTPQKTGLLAYTCSMGMYTGEFTVTL